MSGGGSEVSVPDRQRLSLCLSRAFCSDPESVSPPGEDLDEPWQGFLGSSDLWALAMASSHHLDIARSLGDAVVAGWESD